MRIHVGTSGYAYKEWKGRFYPDNISSGQMLHFYAQRFSAVEINSTYYRMPTPKVLTSWAQQVPEGFLFSVKAPQVITHVKRLRNVGEETEFLFGSLSALGAKKGPVLFQFPASLRADSARLEEFLSLVPADTLCAFEFRSPTWLDTGILDILRQRGCSLCTADTDENPADEIVSTASWGYLRLRRSDYAAADLSQWAKIILSQDWDKAFVFFKHEEEARGPELATRFGELAM